MEGGGHHDLPFFLRGNWEVGRLSYLSQDKHLVCSNSGSPTEKAALYFSLTKFLYIKVGFFGRVYSFMNVSTYKFV